MAQRAQLMAQPVRYPSMERTSGFCTQEQLQLDFGNAPNEVASPLLKMRGLIDDLLDHQEHIEDALSYGDDSHSFDDVSYLVMAGKVDMYTFPNSIIIMELTKYPGHSVYHGFIAAGALKEILDAHPMIEAEAKKRGAKYLSIAGRRGWERPMMQHGWVPKLTIMKKELL